MSHLLVYGAETPPVDPIELRAGPLSMLFEPSTGFLRLIRIGESEVLRGIYAAVREGDWSTVLPVITGLTIQAAPYSFRVSFTARHRALGVDFQWQARIFGTPEGQITYTFEGEALANLRTNRTGFCVLHPASLGGSRCLVEHTDGEREGGIFPDLISPDQPFFAIRAIEHTLSGGGRIRVEMTGDTFEMEDQRNWTDASFKTYCRPHSLPKPYTLARGTKVRQSVRVSISDPQIDFAPVVWRPRVGPSGSEPVPAPSVGTVTDSNVSAGSLNLGHTWSLEEDRDGLRLYRIRRASQDGGSWVVACPPEAIGQAQAIRGDASMDGLVVGSESNFTELNRARPAPGLADALAFATNAQVHAFDTRSIFETLPTQAECVRTVRSFGSGPIHVGPIRFGGRADPRQSSLVGAAWTLGSLKYLAEAGVESATYFHADELRTEVGWTPAYHVLLDVCELSEGEVIPTRSNDPDKAAMLYLRHGERWRTLVANLTARPTMVEIEGLSGACDLRRLNEETVERAILSPATFRNEAHERVEPASGKFVTTLSAYEVVRLDGV